MKFQTTLVTKDGTVVTSFDSLISYQDDQIISFKSKIYDTIHIDKYSVVGHLEDEITDITYTRIYEVKSIGSETIKD